MVKGKRTPGLIKDFTDLKVWQHARELSTDIEHATRNFPDEELFALIGQVRRAVVSISSTIAEALNRQTVAGKLDFYAMARSSADEVRSQLYIALDLKYIDRELFDILQGEAI